MKTIITRYHGWTNSRPARYSATDGDRNRVSVTVGKLPDSASSDEKHALAAHALCVKMKWPGQLIGGHLPKGDMAWVFDDIGAPRFRTAFRGVSLEAAGAAVREGEPLPMPTAWFQFNNNPPQKG